MLQKIHHLFVNGTSKLTDLSFLLLRLILAYGFFHPALMKLKNIKSTSEWFESMGYPFPYFNAFLSGVTEMVGVILLILGLGTRFIALPLQIIMLVAIFTLHFDKGFNAGDNGYEIPLYYLLMLLVLMAQGAGKYSLDYLFKTRN